MVEVPRDQTNTTKIEKEARYAGERHHLKDQSPDVLVCNLSSFSSLIFKEIFEISSRSLLTQFRTCCKGPVILSRSPKMPSPMTKDDAARVQASQVRMPARAGY